MSTPKWTLHEFDTAPERRPPRLPGRQHPLIQRTRAERRSFNVALLVSLLVHAVLLSQLFGGGGLGLPGLVLPWRERRVEVPDVQVVLVPAPVTAAAPSAQPVAPPLAEKPAPKPPASPAPPPPPGDIAAVVKVPERITPRPPVEPAAVAVVPSASSPDPVALAAREATREAARAEAARLERLEAERQEIARQAAAQQLEAQRQEAARQALARAEAERLETERQEAARLEAEREEATRQAAAQLEAQRQEAARQTAARAEAARLEVERQEAATRKAAAQQEAARAQAAQDVAAKREARLRAIGRELDEENARRDAAANNSPAPRPSGALPLSLSTARRARLWGHTDPNAELVEYAQAWALKIQLNTLPAIVRDVTRRPHTPPTVTVALRSDGSVESVTFVVSSGVPDIDEAIRRIVETQRPYPAFPPAMAREFDVVEIRRTWHFDAAVRLH